MTNLASKLNMISPWGTSMAYRSFGGATEWDGASLEPSAHPVAGPFKSALVADGIRSCLFR